MIERERPTIAVRLGRVALMVLALSAAGGVPAVSAQFGLVENMSPPGVQSSHPDVATDPAGTATVVWDADGAAFVVQARRLTVTGQLESSQDLSTESAASADPRVATDPSGRTTVVWRQRVGGNAAIVRARRIAPDGAPGPIVDLSAFIPRIDAVEVAVDPGGHAIVVWSATEAGAALPAKVQARRIAADGALGPLLDVFDGSALQFVVEGRPRVGVDALGTATVAWLASQCCSFDPIFVHARRIGSDGGLGPVIEVMTLARDLFEAGVAVGLAVDPAGIATVLARTDFGPSANSTFLARRIDAGGALGTTHTIAPSTADCIAQGPGAVVSDAGRTTIVWGCFTFFTDGPITFFIPLDAGVRARQIDPNDQLGPLVDLSPNGAGDIDGPAVPVVVAGTSGVAAVWRIGSRMQARRILPGGRLGTTVDAASIDGAVRDAHRAAADPVGRTTVVWSIATGSVQATQGWVPVFGDVPRAHAFQAWIEALFAAGITGGCHLDPLLYCPDDGVTREQMAVFLVRAIHGPAFDPPAATGTVFADVPAAHPFARWIEQLARDGLTGGCGGPGYCPDATVTRGQMAVFLVRAFDLPI